MVLFGDEGTLSFMLELFDLGLGVAVGKGFGRSAIGRGVEIGCGEEGRVISGWSLEIVPRTGTTRILGVLRGGGVGLTVMLRIDWLRFTRAPVRHRLVRVGILSAFPYRRLIVPL